MLSKPEYSKYKFIIQELLFLFFFFIVQNWRTFVLKWPLKYSLNSQKKKGVQISQSRYTHVAHNYYTNTQYLLPWLTAGAAHLPGDQILCGGNRIHILAGSSAQKTGGPRSCRGPTAAVLYFWTTAPHYTLTLFYNTPQKCLPKSVEFNIYFSALCILYLWRRLRNLCIYS